MKCEMLASCFPKQADMPLSLTILPYRDSDSCLRRPVLLRAKVNPFLCSSILISSTVWLRQSPWDVPSAHERPVTSSILKCPSLDPTFHHRVSLLLLIEKLLRRISSPHYLQFFAPFSFWNLFLPDPHPNIPPKSLLSRSPGLPCGEIQSSIHSLPLTCPIYSIWPSRSLSPSRTFFSQPPGHHSHLLLLLRCWLLLPSLFCCFLICSISPFWVLWDSDFGHPLSAYPPLDDFVSSQGINTHQEAKDSRGHLSS